MNIWLVLTMSFTTIAYILARMLEPVSVGISTFEIDRRIKEGDERARHMRMQLIAEPLIAALRRLVGLILLLILAVSIVGLLGVVGAVLVPVLIALAVDWLVGLKPARKLGQKLYARIEPSLLRLPAHESYFFFLRLPSIVTGAGRIQSEAELLHQVGQATFLEPERRTLIKSSLEFTGLSVADAMSGRRSIKAVDKGEVLGPLLLDELYKTGRQSFVVIDGSLDMVVGILKLDRLTSLDLKDTPTALKAMSPEVHFVDRDSAITDALGYLRSSKAPFLVVQDGDGKTVGLLGMDNILRCLFEQ